MIEVCAEWRQSHGKVRLSQSISINLILGMKWPRIVNVKGTH